jgi:predicted aspartyl protease
MAACSASVITLATQETGAQDPQGIAVSDSGVFWTNNNGNGTVMSVAASGGTPVTIAKAQANPLGIAVGPTDVYWTDYSQGASGTIMSAPLPQGQ